MDKLLAAITIHLPEDSRRQFRALAAVEGLDSSGLGRMLVERYLQAKRAELSILLDVFDVNGTLGTSGTEGGGGAAE